MPSAADPAQEIAALRALLAERKAELAAARAELTGARLQIEQYRAQLAVLRRMQFGRSSEKLDVQIEQLELLLEDLEEGKAAARRAPVTASVRIAAASGRAIICALFRGVLQADAFSGYEALARAAERSSRGPPAVTHAACWAHARRKFYDVFESTKSPIAEEALRRIGELYAIETEIAGQRAERRLAARQARAVPLLAALRDWLAAQRRRPSAKNALARAIQ